MDLCVETWIFGVILESEVCEDSATPILIVQYEIKIGFVRITVSRRRFISYYRVSMFSAVKAK